VPAPSWLATRELHAFVSGGVLENGSQRVAAGRRYADWVAAGRDARRWANSLRQGKYLGDDAFIERVERAANELSGS
jgi:hypothetical protein